MEPRALTAWRRQVVSHDPAAMLQLLHADVVLESPIVHTPQRGREITLLYLTAAVTVLAGPSFRYVREWHSDGGAVLEFETEVEGVRINGVDLFTFSEDGGQITALKVMVRPLKAINLLHRLMGEQLATLGA